MAIYNDEKGLLFFTNPQKLLLFFLNDPDNEYFDRDIAYKTGMSYSGTNFALRDLASVGLLKRTVKGRMVFYRLNNDNALVASYLEIASKL